MKNLEASFNPEFLNMVAEAKRGNELLPIPESSASALSVCIEFAKPRTFQEAWNHPDLKHFIKWREAIRKEFSNMNKQQVWRKIKCDKIPKGRHCVECKWVIKIKRNGIFWACLVACGYSQIPGVDF